MNLTPHRRDVLMRLATGPKTIDEARAERRNIMPSLIRMDLAQWCADNDGKAVYQITDKGREALNMATPDTIFKKALPGEPIIDLTYATQQVAEKLPGWCWRIGTCFVSDDAWIAPDYNDPVHGARLKAELGPVVFNSIFDAGVDIDRRPPGNLGQAILDAMEIALEAVALKALSQMAEEAKTLGLD